MVKDMPQRKNLYALCNEISIQTEVEDELAEIIGYYVARGIINSKQISQGNFRELKAVYASLEQAIQEVETKGSYNTLYQIRQKLETPLKEIQKERKKEKKNVYSRFVNLLISSEGNIEETLRQTGFTLIENIKECGPSKRGQRKIRVQDRLILIKSFDKRGRVYGAKIQ